MEPIMTDTVRHVQSENKIPILLILLLSLGLNLYCLADDSFWGDEILTATFATQPPMELIRWTAQDIHPPLYYILVGTFTRFMVHSPSPTVGSDWLWRFPSAVAGVVTVALSYQLARQITRQKLWMAALLISVAPIVIKYNQEARMHALFMGLTALSTWLFFRAIAQPQRKGRWVAFAVATTAHIYTMYFGFLILATQAIFALLSFKRPKGKPILINFSLSTVLIIVFYGPWWPILFNILRKRAAVGAIEGGVGSPMTFIQGVVQALGPQPQGIAWTFLVLFFCGVLFLSRISWARAIFVLSWLALPTILPIFLGDPRALQFRYAFVLPIYLIVVAYAVIHLSAWLSPAWTTYFFWILATLSLFASLAIYQQTKPNWRAAATYLEAETTGADIILVGPLWDEGRFIDYYYQGEAQILTPAAFVANIERRVESMRAYGGRIWAVNRFAPQESNVLRNVYFPGVVVSEPQLPIYEEALLTQAAIDLSAQAVEAAYPWAAQAEAEGILDPDPRTAQAAALRMLGDVLVMANRPNDALVAYQKAVDIFPGWVNGFLALAETQEKVGDLQAAVEAYRQAVSFNLNWHGPEADEAAALAEAGKWEIALQKYHRITNSE